MRSTVPPFLHFDFLLARPIDIVLNFLVLLRHFNLRRVLVFFGVGRFGYLNTGVKSFRRRLMPTELPRPPVDIDYYQAAQDYLHRLPLGLLRPDARHSAYGRNLERALGQRQPER